VIKRQDVICTWWQMYQAGSNPRPSGERAYFYPLSWDDDGNRSNICIIYQCNSGHFTTSENEWNRRNTTKLMFPRLCPLKSKGEDFKDGFQIFQFSWILLPPKHSLLKYLTLTFTRHKSSKFEGSGPLSRVGLGVSRTHADSQWNLVYNAFHRFFCCANEMIRR